MRWTKAPRIVETKLKSGKIKFQVVEHLVDGRRIRKSVGLENVDPTNRGLLSETRLIAKTMEGDLIKEFYNQKAGLPSSNAQVTPMCEAIEVQAYAAKNFEFRLERTKQNSYQRPKRKLDAEQIEADIRWHRRRADAWSKNPDKRHLVEGERQQIMHLQNQLKDIT